MFSCLVLFYEVNQMLSPFSRRGDEVNSPDGKAIKEINPELSLNSPLLSKRTVLVQVCKQPRIEERQHV